jgi:acyl transferase domain-containing protein/acyl-CoA synthetase (AMP-forming)/AMP-acid ligase II/NAD(P)-dependent dehydrogenase (short-subunit alcohol dehydrogenase family)/acyl carrier protein
MKKDTSSIVDVLCSRALHQPDRLAYAFLRDGKTEEARLTYKELHDRTWALAARLYSMKARGERVLLIYPPGLDFIIAFYACLRASLIAVPAPPPEPGRLKRSLPRLQSIAGDSKASLLLATGATLATLVESLSHVRLFPAMEMLATDDTHPLPEVNWTEPEHKGEMIAYLQYTSGSTREPRGVMISHENIMHHSACLRTIWAHREDSIVVNWLPHFHDFALIDGIIQPLYSGIPSYIMAPLAFLKHPCRWLEAIAKYRATHSQAPDFAYDLCATATTPQQRAALDLTRWRMAGNGSETVRRTTIERFTGTFASCGFRPEALCPGYGLAEATLVVSAKDQGETVSFMQLDTSALEKNQVLEGTREKARITTAVSCGKPIGKIRVVIVDPGTLTRSPADKVGEVWIADRSVAQGYWNRPDETREIFRAHLADTGEGPFLRTGDLGFLKNGELYITGRLKDLIIINGINHYPQDIEYTVEGSHPGIRKNHCAAFSITMGSEERAVVICEIERVTEDRRKIIAAIRQAVTESHEIEVHAVALLRKGTIAKTSSGKVQRHACRKSFMAGDLDPLEEWVRASKPPQESIQGWLLSRLAEKGDRLLISSGEKGVCPPFLSPFSVISKVKESIQGWLLSRLAEHLNCSQEELSIDEPFAHYGLSSKDSVRFAADLEEFLGRQLSPALFWQHTDIGSLASYLASLGGKGGKGKRGTDSGGKRGTDSFFPGGNKESVPPFPRSLSPHEPIAIIGMACRFPGGADDPEKFWDLLRNGIDAITEIPADRWDVNRYYDPDVDAPGKMYTRSGGFLTDIDLFDPLFFGISPREAESMDPQQRLLLEVTWEAIERASQQWDRLRGSTTGVFIGISTNDYRDLMVGSGDFSPIDPFFSTGVTSWGAAGRISYVLGFQGPCMAIDTACSSSLVAVDAACGSLWSGKCRQALAGGVNVILSPMGGIAFSRLRSLSPDGRCRAFDASAEGYGRSEGCGVIVMKRLSDAIADDDMVLALIKGTAVNQNGRGNGLTSPGVDAQRDLIRKAFTDAGIHASEVGYVEAHGSGTSLGDLIELSALGSVVSEGRRTNKPLFIGSVKTNIGHMEAAAGIGGIIKTVLALEKGEIPPHIHFNNPTPLVKWKESSLQVPTAVTPWPRRSMKRIAGVSSFGLSGVNAHIVLEEAPRHRCGQNKRKAHRRTSELPSHIITLSAKSEEALREMAGRYQAFLAAHPHIPLANVAYSATVGRQHFPERLAIVTTSQADLCRKIGMYRGRKRPSGLFTGKVNDSRQPVIAFLFTGQGSPYRDRGRQLFETQPVFRQMIERCDNYLRSLQDIRLIDLLYAGKSGRSRGQRRSSGLREEGVSRLIEPREGLESYSDEIYTQPALFSLEVALLALWKSWGIEPAIVLGQSLGEYTAACAAGIFDVEDGLKLITERARLVQQLCEKGEMATVFAGSLEVQHIINGSGLGDKVSIAVINGPEILTIGGDRWAMKNVLAIMDTERIRYIRLKISHAFHCPGMEPVMEAFRKVAGEVAFSPPGIPVVSNITGDMASGEISAPEYWCRHLREPVRFFMGVEFLYREGADILLEVGPDATLIALAQCLPREGKKTVPLLASLRAGIPDAEQMLQSLGALHCAGAHVDWQEFYRYSRPMKIALPSYPFQRRRYWWSDAAQARQKGACGEQESHGGKLIEILGRADPGKLVHHLDDSAQFSAEELRIIREELKALPLHVPRPPSGELNVLYTVKWEPAPPQRDRQRRIPEPGLWIIFADRSPLCSLIAQILRHQGCTCVMAYRGDSCSLEDGEGWILDPLEPGHFMDFFQKTAGSGDLLLKGVIYGWGLDIPGDSGDISPAERQAVLCAGLLHAIQMLARKAFFAPLWLITAGAVHCEEHPASRAIAQAPLWALGKVLSTELPEIWGGMLDLDPGALSLGENAERIVSEITEPGYDDHVAFRAGKRYAARIVRLSLSEKGGLQFNPDAVYLITGGLGGLGRKVARWMGDYGARHLVLTGRRGVMPEDEGFIRELTSRGIDVMVRRADVSSLDDMRGVFEEIDRTGFPLKGIFHSAGIFDNRILVHLTHERFSSMTAPKAQGAWNLHVLTTERSLDFFVLFSSAASVIGGRGLGHYAAANAFMDALAQFRTAKGLTGLSINWGPWDESGMGDLADDRSKIRFSAVGVRSIPSSRGLRILEILLSTSMSPSSEHLPAQVCVYSVEWPVLRRYIPAGRQQSFFSRLEYGTSPVPETAEGITVRLNEVPVDKWEEIVTPLVKDEVAAVLRFQSSEALSPFQNFLELGMDSLMAIELRTRLSRLLGQDLPPLIVANHSSINSIVEYLIKEVHKPRIACVDERIEGRKRRITYRLADRDSRRYVGEIKECLSSEPYVQKFSADYLCSILDQRKALLVFEHNTLIGFSFWEPLQFPLGRYKAVALLTAFLKKEYRGRHIGSRMIYLRNEFLEIQENILVQSIFDERLKMWAIKAGFKKVGFNHFGPDFLHYYCDCEGTVFNETCPYRDRECELVAHFPFDPYYPSYRPDIRELQM